MHDVFLRIHVEVAGQNHQSHPKDEDASLSPNVRQHPYQPPNASLQEYERLPPLTNTFSDPGVCYLKLVGNRARGINFKRTCQDPIHNQ